MWWNAMLSKNIPDIIFLLYTKIYKAYKLKNYIILIHRDDKGAAAAAAAHSSYAINPPRRLYCFYFGQSCVKAQVHGHFEGCSLWCCRQLHVSSLASYFTLEHLKWSTCHLFVLTMYLSLMKPRLHVCPLPLKRCTFFNWYIYIYIYISFPCTIWWMPEGFTTRYSPS